MISFIILVIAFVLGSLPFSSWVAGFHRVELREHGSGNLGATNVYRVLGWRAGVVALTLDVLKGLLAVVLARAFTPGNGALQAFAGGAAILGHVWSPFLGFRGGKGVAASFGVFLALAPVPTLLTAGLWLGIVLLCGWVSLASMVAVVFLPLVLILAREDLGTRYSWTLVVSLAVLAVVLFRHRSNWRRLMAGEERPVWDGGDTLPSVVEDDASAGEESQA